MMMKHTPDDPTVPHVHQNIKLSSTFVTTHNFSLKFITSLVDHLPMATGCWPSVVSREVCLHLEAIGVVKEYAASFILCKWNNRWQKLLGGQHRWNWSSTRLPDLHHREMEKTPARKLCCSTQLLTFPNDVHNKDAHYSRLTIGSLKTQTHKHIPLFFQWPTSWITTFSWSVSRHFKNYELTPIGCNKPPSKHMENT